MRRRCRINMKEDQIAEFLERKLEWWSFSRLLGEVYRGEEALSSRLNRKLSEYGRSSEEDRESVARKVRNWLSDSNRPGSREELFRICFALALNEERADAVLCSTAESGIHYRNPKELIYAFCLRVGYDYPRAQELLECMGQKSAPHSDMEQRKAVRRSSGRDFRQCVTVSVRDEFKRVRNEEELLEFLQRHREVMGLHHNTAYAKFLLMLERLMEGGDEAGYAGAPDERRFSIDEVAEAYLGMGVPRGRGHTKLQKEIRRYWPSAKTVREMYTRKADVNRKTLLLLYIATEGMGGESPDGDGFREHCRRIDLMLSQCGMALLDPHNPFDFLVLQSLRLEGEDDSISWRMERFLGSVFRSKDAAYIEARGKGR